MLPALCFIPGFYAVCWALHQPLRSFMIAVFGGMLVRLLFIGTVLALVVKLTQLHLSSFVCSLVGFYMLYLAIELYFIHGRLPRQEGISR
jgi:hypothetical protein